MRDLRLCHGGMPNESSEIRTMLAMVHTAAAYRGADETQFKGFEAAASSAGFWYRLCSMRARARACVCVHRGVRILHTYVSCVVRARHHSRLHTSVRTPHAA